MAPLYPILSAASRVLCGAVPSVTPSRRLLVALPALGALAAPAAAQAQTALAPLKPCYVSVSRHERQVLDTFATGFTPHADVDVTIGGKTEPYVVNSVGAVDLRRVRAPFRRRGQRPFTLTVTERGNPLNTVSGTAYVTALSVRVRPRRAATWRRVRFRGRGFTAAAPIWGHYLYRGSVRRTVRLADGPQGICGRFSVRRRQIPVRHPRPGRWILQVDQQRDYSPRPASVFVPVRISVRRVAG
jgi:hypothetical protein